MSNRVSCYLEEIVTDNRERVEILNQMMNYYRMHLTEFPTIKSLAVLQEVFS